MLSALGLDRDEECLYRHLVAATGSPSDLAGRAVLPLARTIEVLDCLVARGLAVAGPHGTFAAAPPAIALGALLRRQRDELHAAELALLALVDEHRRATSGRSAGDLVEVITDVGAVRHCFAQLQQGARHEVCSLIVPGLAVVPHKDNTAGDDGLRRGVHYRVIVDRESLAEPGLVQLAASSIAEGEEIRVVDRVPVKMIIVDGRTALLPLLSGQHTAPASVLVHASGLLDALIALFETLWTRAYPLWTDGATVGERGAGLEPFDTRIVALLLAGLTDQAIAGQLDTSLRTVQRRIHALMQRAGAETRIQLGWHAARNGWA
ncbi:transcriptional regulator TrmB [Dactylosporangium sp. NBC_01737]|uniref:helix-turn-helix domain-containing protein n=1 Tax=Dactylosporangium sp. NBC_01737 TaxID=2975959 RepID=UPI002E13DA5C|nr:transcriptional regulator TrmB [Dactylosporangium sp. NBC_01737]